MDLKECKRCGEKKPLSNFNVDPQRTDGRHPYCTPCKTAPYSNPGKREAHRQEVRDRTEKHCNRCSILKPLENFHKRAANLDGHHNTCKECVQIESSQNYDSQKNKEYWVRVKTTRLQETRVKRESRKLELIIALGGKCIDCGISPGDEWPVACFDFHHTTESKEKNIGHILMKKDWEAVKLEASKCVVVCATCHRRRHARGE